MEMSYSRVSYFLLVFCCLTSSVFSQLKVTNSPDTVKVRTLIAKAKSYENTSPDSATYYYEKAQALALEIKDGVGLENYFSHYIRFLNHKAQFEEGFLWL